MPTCALCRTEVAELRESHIYPKFSYRRMREGENRFLHYTTARPGADPRPAQDGFKQRLLCDACERRLQPWEEYFARVANQRQLFDLPRPVPPRWVVFVEGLEYRRTKLFFISLLWRATVASIEPFQAFTLGEKHESRLRTLLLSENPGEPWEYGPVLCTPFIVDPDNSDEIVRPPLTMSPHKVRVTNGIQAAHLLVDGLLMSFFVGSAEAVRSYPLMRLCHQPDAPVPVAIENIVNFAYIRDAWARTFGFVP